jgi:hypothetical protein
MLSCQSSPPAASRSFRLGQISSAEDWFVAMRAFPRGIPAGARANALLQAAQLDGGPSRVRRFKNVTHDIASASSSWFPIGPTPVSSVTATGGFYASGRATVIAPNPANPSEVWLGTATGGVWHTLNAQSTDPEWVPVDGLQFTDGIPGPNGSVVAAGAMAMAIGAIAPDGCTAAGCTRVWVGTGEDGVRRDSYYGAGLFQLNEPVIQKGIHHNVAAPGPGLLSQVADFRTGSVVAMALGPHAAGTATNMLYIAVSSGVTSPASTEATTTAPAPSTGYGIFATTDGTTFNKLPVPGVDRSLPTDVELDPSDSTGNTILVGFMAKDVSDTTAARGILRGTNGGKTAGDWCSLNDNTAAGITSCAGSSGLPAGNRVVANPPVDGQDEVLGYITLAYSPNVANRVYARVGQCGQRADYGCVPAVYRSDNDGTTWSPLALSFPGFSTHLSYDRYTHPIAVVPGSPPASEQILVGGVVLFVCPGGGGSCASFGNTDKAVHADHHAIVFPVAGNPNVIYDANDGGFFFTTTGAMGWTAGNTTLTTNQLDSLAVVDHNLLAGLQDNGQAFFNGTRVWTKAISGDGGGAVAYQFGDPSQPQSAWFYTPQRALPIRSINDPTNQAAQTVLGHNFPASANTEFVNNPSPTCQGGTCTYTGGTGSLFTGGSCVVDSDCPIPASQVAFFAPLALNRSTHDVYIASTEIYMSAPTTDDAHRGDAPWSAVSPILATPTGALLPDVNTDNVITALGVGDDGAVYAGTYVGEVWASAAPCASSTCWTKVAGPGGPSTSLPLLPVSSIAVAPGNSATAYVTFSGFGTTDHVWTTTTRGASWSSASGGLMDAPANVVRYDVLGKLWLGTDIGIYSFDGSTWTRDTTLPFVPVTEIASWPAEGGTERVYAATHGRGAWTLTSPTVNTLEGWSMGSIWDVPVHGYGFPNGTGGNAPCTISLVQQSGNVCASGTVAVNTSNPSGTVPGGDIFVDTSGMLQTTAPSTYPQGQTNVPVVWACKEGTCLNNTPIQNCNMDANHNPDEISTVIVDCGSAGKGQTRILNAPALGNPPSSSLLFDPPNPPSGPTWTFEAVVSITAQTGALLLCRAPVTVSQQAEPDVMAAAAAAALNASAQCQAAGVTARASESRPVTNGEDPEEAVPSALIVEAPNQLGSELFVTFRSAPALATGLCFTLQGLGNPALHQSAIMQTVVSTAQSGAAGGSIRIIEGTEIGVCQQDVPTTAGMTASQVASAIGQAFDSVTSPGPANCPARYDALDLQVSGATIFSVTASSVQVCSFDPGVGLAITPDTVDVPDLPPDCSAVKADPAQLWPPNHKFVPVTLSGATDPDGDSVTIEVTQVRQDEDPRGRIDAEIEGGQLLLRAERHRHGDGRVYHVQFTASDGRGGTCSGETTVCVPHHHDDDDSDDGDDCDDDGWNDPEHGRKCGCVDEGALYPSGIP